MTTKIAELLDIEHTPAEVQPNTSVVPQSGDVPEDADFEFARSNYYDLIDQGKAAVNTAMLIAAETQNPRAIEVLSTLLKNMADINKQLVTLSKDKADVKNAKGMKQQPAQQIGTVQQAVFVGSSADLNKMLAGNKE